MPIDYKKYPPNWLKEIRPRIMNRANDSCEVCGFQHNQTVYAIKMPVRNVKGKYVSRSIWFSREECAIREDISRSMKPVKVVITIAHLDHDEENNNVTDERLMAMCQLCHLRYDAQEKYNRSLHKSPF